LTFDNDDHPKSSPLYQSVYSAALVLFQAMIDALSPGTHSPFEQIRRVNEAGNPHWSSRDFARVIAKRGFVLSTSSGKIYENTA
jgi:hypothetical protein